MNKIERQLSPEVGEKFLACFANLTGLHETFLREGDDVAKATFHAVRTAMTADAAFVSRLQGRTHDSALTDEQFREMLHKLLDLAITDFQFNERLHTSKGD